MVKLLAFHGDNQLKIDVIAEIKRHQEQDLIIKGSYGENGGKIFKGCGVGCSIHSLNITRGKSIPTNSHQAYETEFGIPIILAYLEDGIFEGLPNSESVKFPYRFMSAINVGADLSRVHSAFLAWLLDDPEHGVIRFADDLGKVSIHQIAALHRQEMVGEIVPEAAWSAARSAAWSAAESAARSAARSAAWSAAESAARSAAWSAAESAARSAAESAAESAARSAQSEKLLELLTAAK